MAPLGLSLYGSHGIFAQFRPRDGKEVGEASGKAGGMEEGEMGDGKLARPEDL